MLINILNEKFMVLNNLDEALAQKYRTLIDALVHPRCNAETIFRL
jgi:hypothetical protein